MQPLKILIPSLILALSLVACTSHKHLASSPAAPASTTVTAPVRSGWAEPGSNELMAIQAKYPGTTLATLNEGHSIYVGACKSCHEVKNIYRFSSERWVDLIDQMAPKARLSPSDKDALSRYVFSMKATQPAPGH